MMGFFPFLIQKKEEVSNFKNKNEMGFLTTNPNQTKIMQK
jgi:hypothetical protein